MPLPVLVKQSEPALELDQKILSFEKYLGKEFWEPTVQ